MSASSVAIDYYNRPLSDVYRELLRLGMHQYFDLKFGQNEWWLNGASIGVDGPGGENVPELPAALIEWMATRFAITSLGVTCEFDRHKYSIERGREVLEYKNIPMYCLVIGAAHALGKGRCV